MTLFNRDQVKHTLQRIGLFPIARTAYRALSPSVRAQRSHEIAFYGSLLRPNSLCFDVGANLGQKAEVFLSCGARVIILEPNVLCHATLSHLFNRNPNARIVSTAVGSSRGSTDLHVHGTDSTASVRLDWDRQVYGIDRTCTALAVPVTTLDDLIEHFGRPDFIKIDVEGSELEVVKGLSSAVPLLSLEYHFEEIDRLWNCLAILRRLGKLSVRPSNMRCDWLGPKMHDMDACLRILQSVRAKGDMFVWIS
jgi:FkbM family methyltransferase